MKVFKNKYGQWETLFQNHMLNGETVKYYMSVQFQKGYEPIKDSIDMELIRWWGSCFLTRDGVAKPKLFIADWREIEPALKEEPKEDFNEVKEEKGVQLNFNGDDLPFY